MKSGVCGLLMFLSCVLLMYVVMFAGVVSGFLISFVLSLSAGWITVVLQSLTGWNKSIGVIVWALRL